MQNDTNEYIIVYYIIVNDVVNNYGLENQQALIHVRGSSLSLSLFLFSIFFSFIPPLRDKRVSRNAVEIRRPKLVYLRSRPLFLQFRNCSAYVMPLPGVRQRTLGAQ